jgi:hypothetical protein
MCWCQDCGNEYQTDVIIPNDLWERIKPVGKPEGGGLLCGQCIIKRVEAVNGYSSWRLVSA